MICSASRPTLVRGATLDRLALMPAQFADGQFAGWVPTSQVRTPAGLLIATLDVQWIDPAVTRVLRLRCADTSAWPIGTARLDIRLTSPDGYRLQSRATTLLITHGETQL